jgi:hypothetical protein
MRLYSFLSISSGDNEESAFRSLNLDLVEEDTGNADLVKRVSEKYMLDDAALMLLEKANKELKKMYRGKLRFDFCLEEQGMTPDEVKIERRKVRQLKEKWFQFNDELSNIQLGLEKTLRKGLQK